ncbi:ATP-binding cassette domain-containing protein [Mesorhizobium sp. M1378]|uniref:ATP-binding cassette domain-containing protein n=1 Tax=Mesorhizobium sp. M1378 TaxID=2957092 RepID=UPI003334C470
MNQAPLLELKDISKSFGRVQSLRGINLNIRSGEVLGLLGDNGAGKSTLIKILAGVHQPTTGALVWKGQTITLPTPRDAMARGISVVYQDLSIIPLLSIYRNFFLGREDDVAIRLPGLMVLKRHKMRCIARDALKQLGIHIDDVDLSVARLSGGERQSIAIARAVHFQSELLILDEPTAALSLKETEKVLSYVREARRQGVAVVLITHNISHAYEVCDRFGVVYHGRIAEISDRNDITTDELASLINTGSRGIAA